jgi:hypothetical protein
MDTNLPEDKRIQLDTIVKKMVDSKETDDNIRFVVDDFKTKYSQPVKAAAPTTKPKTFWESVSSAIPETYKGVAKGAASTILSTGQLGANAMNKVFGQDNTELNKDINEFKTSKLKPSNDAQKLGFNAEQIAEFLIPSTKASKLVGASAKIGEAASSIKLLSGSNKLKSAANIAAKALTEASLVGGQSAMQKGTIDKNVALNGIVAGMFPIVGAGLSAAKRSILKPVGEKIQNTVIRPNGKDLSDGFDIKNVTKYGVGGSLKDTVAKTHAKMNELVSQLDEKLKGDLSNVNLEQVYQNTISQLSSGKMKNFGDTQAIARAVQSLKEEISNVSENGLVNLVDATNIKRGAGTKGAWAYNRPEPDSSAIETTYTAFYNQLKNAIEQAAPAGVKEINKKISELIPISNASLRRLPVEQRNNIIGLTDSIGLFSAMFDPKALALIGANKLSKSGKFGQFLVNVANKKPTTGLGKRIFN